jgi:lantibiotic modifying enzyme
MKKLLSGVMLLAMLGTHARAGDPGYLDVAKQAAQWIRKSALKTERGIVWLADPTDRETVETSLYTGTPGVILFFIEAYHATGDTTYLQDARAGADQLLAAMADQKESGLYVGLAGIGFALEETFKATRDQRYRDGAIQCAQTISKRAIKTGKGIEWSETTDIISGSAGIGLFLLYAARRFQQPALVDLAQQAGQRLIELGQPEASGLKWAMSPSFKRLMPNFSHGTAGIAYFLATLYQETKRKEFLDAALAGAKYLQAVAKTDGDVCLIFHNEPDGRDLYYLGWCHGPVGTARLFYRLYQATGDRAWMEWVKKSGRALAQSGIPDKQTPGFWNNVSQCCGSAGVAEFFLSLAQITGDRTYLEFAKRVTANLLARATRDANGARWVQAEHRVKPELLIAQTGYMQGAAGIGMLLLRLHEFEHHKQPAIGFPDTPF